MADNQTEKQKVQELTDKLERGLAELFNSDSYKGYLSTMSKFHNYSFNNTLLIAMQKPEASLVAGYNAWQKNFGRHVNKGEKAIRILAPVPYKIKEEREKVDPITQEIMIDRDGNPQKEEVEITIPAFHAVSVFDVSQTDGKPIPELEAKELLSGVEGYQDMIHAVEAVSPVPIEMEEIDSGAKGYFDREAGRIAVQDTIRRTASELITGIEEQLEEIRRDREVSQEQTKESILLIQNADLSEFSLLDVYGMDRQELMQALSAMTENDKLSIPAYLESKGAWVTEIGNQDTREYGEYHLDVRYNTDTEELFDMKERKAIYDKAMEQINANDVIVKFVSAFESEWEILKITNLSREDVGNLLKDMAALDETAWDGDYLAYLTGRGAEITLLASSTGLNTDILDLWDFEYDFDAGLTDAVELSAMQQAEHIIHRLEHGQPAFSDDERSLIVNYAYKLSDVEKTRELAEHIYAQEVDGNQDVALAMVDAQAEIDALPDSMVGISEMQEYGYTWNEMLPLTQERALELFDHDLPVYLLHTDGSETTVSDRKQIIEHDGICGIEKGDWQNERKLLMMQEKLTESNSNREAQLLYGNTDKYGIYQLKDNPELDKFRFEGTESLKRMGITKDNFDAVLPENYKLVYLGELSELQGQTQSETLEAIYTKFNIDHPADYKAHSLSVSDIVVLHENGENTAHFVDSFGFTELPKFMLTLEGKENEIETDNLDVVADFRAKTEELFHSLDGQSADDIEKTVYVYVQSQIDEYGLDAEIVDVVVAGSRCRGMEQETVEHTELAKEPVIEPETVHVTFTVAECGEFHNMEEYHEGIETIEEAIQIYQAIDPSRMNGIPSLGMNMHIKGTEEWEDEQADILSGKCIDVDFLNYTPELRDTPKVQDALKKLIAAFPEKEVNDRETKEQKIQALAAELDQLSYEIDTYGYRDSVSDRESQIQMIANDIRTGNVKPLSIFLQASIDEGIDEDSERQAKELLTKLAEYKPLAKIEEIEEQNYNMIDDRLNNGVEKFNREEEKKEMQEKPEARFSLKERLAAKQKEAAQGNNKDTKELEKSKNSHREM